MLKTKHSLGEGSKSLFLRTEEKQVFNLYE